MKKTNRLDYVAYDPSAQSLQADFKEAFTGLFAGVDTLYVTAPSSVELAKVKLEEAYMWIGKAIRDDQIARNGFAILQEQRNDS